MEYYETPMLRCIIKLIWRHLWRYKHHQNDVLLIEKIKSKTFVLKKVFTSKTRVALLDLDTEQH